MFEIYSYNAEVLSVYDGDTIRVKINLGFGLTIDNEPVRLFGINTPELRGDEYEAGVLARDFVRDLLPIGKKVTLITVKDSKGKYGRYLGTIYIPSDVEGDSSLTNLNELLVESGHAKVYYP